MYPFFISRGIKVSRKEAKSISRGARRRAAATAFSLRSFALFAPLGEISVHMLASSPK
jgi:hypothetical protein